MPAIIGCFGFFATVTWTWCLL